MLAAAFRQALQNVVAERKVALQRNRVAHRTVLPAPHDLRRDVERLSHSRRCSLRRVGTPAACERAIRRVGKAADACADCRRDDARVIHVVPAGADFMTAGRLVLARQQRPTLGVSASTGAGRVQVRAGNGREATAGASCRRNCGRLAGSGSRNADIAELLGKSTKSGGNPHGTRRRVRRRAGRPEIVRRWADTSVANPADSRAFPGGSALAMVSAMSVRTCEWARVFRSGRR